MSLIRDSPSDRHRGRVRFDGFGIDLSGVVHDLAPSNTLWRMNRGVETTHTHASMMSAAANSIVSLRRVVPVAGMNRSRLVRVRNSEKRDTPGVGFR